MTSASEILRRSATSFAVRSASKGLATTSVHNFGIGTASPRRFETLSAPLRDLPVIKGLDQAAFHLEPPYGDGWALQEAVWLREVDQLGYPAPKGTPAQKLHIYYQDIPYYGYTVPENVELLAVSPVPFGTASAYIVVENDFYGFPRNDEDVTGTEIIRSGALKVTQAHEFMHAIQFNINVYQSGWLMESSATWAEDAVYGNVNDWHWYVNTFLRTPDYPIFSRYVYGSAFFMNYLTERYGTELIRLVWDAARTQSAPDAIRNVAFGGSWEGMKSFAPAEVLLDLADFRISSVIPQPVNFIRAAHSAYPVSVQVQSSTNKVANRAPWGLGANFVEFHPAGGTSLTLTFDGADGYAWRAMVVARSMSFCAPVVGSAKIAGACCAVK